MHKRKIRVLIVEDSRLYQEYLKKVLESDDQIEISGVANSAAECLHLMDTVDSDIVALDLTLPDSHGLELLKTLVKKYDTPVLVVTSESKLCQEAVALGAKGFIKKITQGELRDREQFAMLLKLKIKTYGTSFIPKKMEPRRRPIIEPVEKREGSQEDLIVMGASLGGTETTLEILKELPTWMPGIVVVQHMTKEFTAAYAARLDRNCSLGIREAKNGDLVTSGHVLIAKGGEQLTLYKTGEGYRVHLKKDDGRQTFCPSVDELFESTAKVAGESATAVILTGMGHDGTKGICKMHDAGAYTIAESEETCVVYGMPRAAWEAGGVDIQLPKYKIAKALIERYEKAKQGGTKG